LRKIFLVLLLIIAALYGFNGKTWTNKNEIIFKGQVTDDSTRILWRKIYALDTVLSKDEEIVIYFDSLGGFVTPTMLLLERIRFIQNKGRVLRGIIYGYCASACGSIFATMNHREMVANSQYMQHLCRDGNKNYSRGCEIYDLERLSHDARMLGTPITKFIRRLKGGPIYIGHMEMLIYGGIERITPIEELHGI